MAKSKDNPSSMFGPIFDSIKENILGTIGRMIRERIIKMEKMIIELALSLAFFVMAIFFILIAVMFFLHKYAHLSYFSSFLIIGIITIIIAFVIYKAANRK